VPDAPASVLQRRYARSERMVGRRIAGEYIIVPIVGRGADLDAIFHLNGVGAFIWEKLDGTTTGEAIAEAIAERYEVDRTTACRDYVEFMEKLESVGAIQAWP
jgi:hypothetical protein